MNPSKIAKTILVFPKRTRFEYFKEMYKAQSLSDLRRKLVATGTTPNDFEFMVQRHDLHQTRLNQSIDCLLRSGFKVYRVDERTLSKLIRERGRIKQRIAAPVASSAEAHTLHRAAFVSGIRAPLLVPEPDPNASCENEPQPQPPTEDFDFFDQDRTPIILSTGGDGTFLLAASLIPSPDVILLGLNTDPERSQGALCMPRAYSYSFEAAVSRLRAGEFAIQPRQRIRVSITAAGPLVQQHRPPANALPPTSREEDEHEQPRLNTDAPPYMGSERYGNVGHTRNDAELTDDDVFDAPVGAGAGGAGDRELDVFSSRDANLRVLQHRALNEVFIGETLSARVSYYSMGVDGAPPRKQKSSGVNVFTGTGSTSWAYNIDQLPETTVAQVLNIAAELQRSAGKSGDANAGGGAGGSSSSASSLYSVSADAFSDEGAMDLARRVTDAYNATLRFDPSQPRMAYTVRDPVLNRVFNVTAPREFATRRVDISSHMLEGVLVLDGSFRVRSAHRFNEGSRAVLELRPEDALSCLHL